MSYRWVDHTAELELHIAALDERAVFEEALHALRELLADDAAGETASFEVELGSPDQATLLARWLDELVYRAETEGLVPTGVTQLALSAGRLAATVLARRGEPRHLVKGVTYHGLELERGAEGYRAKLVLDV